MNYNEKELQSYEIQGRTFISKIGNCKQNDSDLVNFFFLQLLVALAIAAVVAEPEAEANAGAPLPYFGPPYQPNYYANPKKLVAHPAVPAYGYYGYPYHYGHYLGKRSDYELD